MSDSDAYSYEYDESEAGSDAEEASFEYTDDDASNQDNDAVNIENTYYNAKAARDNGEFDEAVEGLENVVVMEIELIRKNTGDDGENCRYLLRTVDVIVD